jgi:Vacuolar protein sorting-associated protein 62
VRSACTTVAVVPGKLTETEKCSVQALAVAVNSGLVDYPVGFRQVWGCEGLTVWQPKAPANYAALGCLITTDGKQPSLSSVVCVHRQVGQV